MGTEGTEWQSHG